MSEKEDITITQTYGKEYLIDLLQKLIEDEFNNIQMVTTPKEW